MMRMSRCSLLFSLILVAVPVAAQNADPVSITPEAAAADPDFAVQGEYVTPETAAQPKGIQVVAQGHGRFRAVIYSGGLPGAGWDDNLPQVIEEEDSEGIEDLLSSLQAQKLNRSSPTLEQPPPEGATVLFDGTPESLEKHWKPGARMDEQGLLMAGAATRDAFRDYVLHLEFRTPYLPIARGQRRGDGGVYCQSRYEVQILDSFGLKGLNNEAGGLPAVRDPDLNMCLPPLSWQTYDIDFTAARFDAQGAKVSNARLTVRLNGVIVQRDVEVPGPTPGAPLTETPQAGPLSLQDHPDPVRYRNIWLLPRDADLEARRPLIPAYERFQALGNHSLEGGTLLIGELGCVNCHAASQGLQAHLLSKRAPILTNAGSRLRRDWMKQFIANPHLVKPGTTMPSLFDGWEPAARDEAVTAITHFLASTGALHERNADPRMARNGGKLFNSIGCLACHAPLGSSDVPSATSVPLADLAAKYTIPSLAQFLKNPHDIRPSGRMPSLNLQRNEPEEIAHYLLQGGLEPLEPNVRYTVYEGRWNELPDFENLKPVGQGTCVGFDLSVAPKPDNFGIRFEAFLPDPQRGAYIFALGSDDGARLSIDGNPVIETDGIHPLEMHEKTGRFEERPMHTVQLDYFEANGGEELIVMMGRQGYPLEYLAPLLTLDDHPPAKSKPTAKGEKFRVDPLLARKGKELFVSIGCANCHEFKIKDQRLTSKLAAQPLAKLNPRAGCVAGSANGTSDRPIPHYDLTTGQQKDLEQAIVSDLENLSPEPRMIVHETMLAFNCYACHQRRGIGGPERSRNALFLSEQPEMGDEGRIPPPLDGVGDKLQESWIENVLDKGAENRPYMLTRMPRFGRGNVGHLAAAFAAQDRRTDSHLATFHEPIHRVKSTGRQLVGNGGLACIKCHTFGDKRATGIQAVSLTGMTSRIREDWFLRYLFDPARYRPGTRMPTGFPGGKAVVKDVYGGDANKQISAIWIYLSDGDRAGLPEGLVAKMIELKPEQEPIIYRNFLEGLSPRGIAVGYPEKVNLAWDANDLCLKLIWHDRFIDASLHWSGRGAGQQRPLGDHILPLEPTIPFARLESRQTPWPKESPRNDPGYQFLSYQLNQQGEPTFTYQTPFGKVTDFPKPVSKNEREGTLRRTLTLTSTSHPDDLYFRAGRGEKIEQTPGGWLIDGSLTVRIQGGGTPFLRKEEGFQELLVPVNLPANGRVELTQELLW
jgi:cytochrome c553